ncbi:hypothetical protein [Clostridium sp.]|uniref:hypothetical protein n=1 Tax=Clostridium sp. TaxID=1506 RepID=UPI002617154D|nr:hypothetical protein [Clostridium sp.]
MKKFIKRDDKTTETKATKKENVANTGFKISELLTDEEKAIMTGVANGQNFRGQEKSINADLYKARQLNR